MRLTAHIEVVELPLGFDAALEAIRESLFTLERNASMTALS